MKNNDQQLSAVPLNNDQQLSAVPLEANHADAEITTFIFPVVPHLFVAFVFP